MTDLAHTYTSDFQFQETQVFSADTEYSATRLGQNTNYLLDAYPPIVNQLNTIAAQAARIGTFQVSANFPANGSFGVMNAAQVGGTQLLCALLFAAPLKSNLTWTSLTSGIFGPSGTQGPSAPIVVMRSQAGKIRNINWPTYYFGGAFFEIGLNGVYNQILINTSGAGFPALITGVVAYV